MVRCVRFVSAVLLTVLCTGISAARAAPISFAESVVIGRPAHPVQIAVREERGATTISLDGKPRRLPGRTASGVTLERVVIGPDAAVAVLRIAAEGGGWIGLFGGRSGRELIWSAASEPEGDPGERRIHALSLEGEPPNVRVGVRQEGVTLCGERPAWLTSSLLDPDSLTLRPATPPETVGTIVDVPVSAGSGKAPVWTGLSAVASSAVEETTGVARVPRAVLDGDRTRGVALRAGSFLLFRWDSRALPIERLEIDLGETGSMPVELRWLTDDASVLRSVIAPAKETSRTIAITPPRPLVGRCLAVEVVRAASSLTVRELRAYSPLDREGGVEALVAALVREEPHASELVSLLAALGPAGARALAPRWDELSARGKRRGLKVLASALDDVRVRSLVMSAAESDDRELRTAALDVLAVGGRAGRSALRELALASSAAGDDGARLLARTPDELPTLLDALAQPGGSDRSALRAAIVAIARRDPARLEALATERAASLEAAPCAALALMASEAGAPALTTRVAASCRPRVTRFEDRYRLARALAQGAPSDDDDAWLTHEADDAAEWMQRQQALASLVSREPVAARAVAERRAQDPYPRVRASAVVALTSSGERAAIEASARDPWPIVRSAAIEALASFDDAGPSLERGLDDGSARVRRAAIEALLRQRRGTAWPKIAERLRTPSEQLPVRAEAVHFAAALCLSAAKPLLEELARATLSPAGTDDDTALAVEALRALAALGGDAARAGAQIVEKAATPALLRLWQRLPPPRCAAGADGGSS